MAICSAPVIIPFSPFAVLSGLFGGSSPGRREVQAQGADLRGKPSA